MQNSINISINGAAIIQENKLLLFQKTFNNWKGKTERGKGDGHFRLLIFRKHYHFNYVKFYKITYNCACTYSFELWSFIATKYKETDMNQSGKENKLKAV